MDNCSYHRLYDDQTSRVIYEETQAVVKIQERIIKGLYELVWSYVLDYEVSNDPIDDRRDSIARWSNTANLIVEEDNEAILSFSKKLQMRGIDLFDALHISCAWDANCDYFITTDRKLLITPIHEIRVVNPIDFIQEEEALR